MSRPRRLNSWPQWGQGQARGPHCSIMSSHSVVVSAVKLAKAVNYVAAQLRIARKPLKKLEATSDVKKMSDSKDPEDVQNPEVKAAAAATVEEMLNTFDDNLGKLDKKVKELTIALNVAFELMKELDKTRKTWSPLRTATARLDTKLSA